MLNWPHARVPQEALMVHGTFQSYWVSKDSVFNSGSYFQPSIMAEHVPTGTTHEVKQWFTDPTGSGISVQRMLDKWNAVDPATWKYSRGK